jgi:glycosyltransferase involved in cell wall biosynthesis
VTKKQAPFSIKKILIVQSKFLHYRKSFCAELSKHFEVVVIHSGLSICDGTEPYTEVLTSKHNCGPFSFQFGLREELRNGGYDAVIAMFDIRWFISFWAMFMWDRKVTWVWWGLDVGASKIALKIKLWIAKRGNPIVFYNSATRNQFIQLGLSPKKLFVGINTFHVSHRRPCFEFPTKNIFLNVGSLDARKENEIVIHAFKKVLHKIGKPLHFVIIGEGSQRAKLEHLIVEERLEGKVILLGEVNDPAKLAEYYDKAIASVSFGQAGLAILQSMAFGVPFVTKKSAISGGEKNNIKDGKNGIFVLNSQSNLEDQMFRLASELDWSRKLGENAYIYYSQNCTVEKMVKGFLQALQFKDVNHEIAC